ncbi:hypothetical protein TNCV_3339251 [Trichonephila clavipes]|nr:hypothetical protein TNCV_3339251 [Trichonephila clavipes]
MVDEVAAENEFLISVIQAHFDSIPNRRENVITALPAVDMRFPHTPTKGDNEHRPAFPVITRDWLLKHHPTAHAFAGLDSCTDVTSRD